MARNPKIKNALDNLGLIKKIDRSYMLGLLLNFPEQLEEALDIAKRQSPRLRGGFSNIVFSGLGGSAVGGDVIRCCLSDEIKVPFVVNRSYFAPKYVSSETLFFASSYSGDTEETISAYKDARRKNAKIVAITTAGELGRLAKKDDYPLIKIPGGLPPRCALGFSFIPALSVLSKNRLIKDKTKDIYEAAKVLVDLRDKSIGPDVPLKDNLAKQIAATLLGRFCAIYGWSKYFDPAVIRWRSQFCENSKSLTTSHFLPEMSHNEIVGFSHPSKVLKQMVAIFFKDEGSYIRIKDRIEIINSIIKNRVYKIIQVESKGQGLISRICSLIYIGDFVSFYLAILNKEDPTPVDEISYLKKELSKRRKA